MGVRVKNDARETNAEQNQSVQDTSFDQREVTVDGYTFHFGPNETKNFLDDGVGSAVAAFQGGATITPIHEDTKSFGSSMS